MNNTASRAEVINGRVRITAADGSRLTLHPIWLRERCPCSECRDTRTGQRLLDAWSIPLETTVETVSGDGDSLRITFSDGHVAPFSSDVLKASLGRRNDRVRVVTWDASLTEWPRADWEAVRRDDGALYTMLEMLHCYGFILLHGVPTEMDAVGEVAERIGPVRRTNWGGIADIKAIPEAFDLTMTARAIEPHADNPYREPVPGYVFLQCIVNDVKGGDLLLSDGFRVAEELRRRAPEEFDALTRVRPEFSYVDGDAILESSGPLIELDDNGRVRQVRLSNRTESVAAEDPDLLERYYRARRRFACLVSDPAFQVRHRWRPGDLVVMDNYRMLHGRDAQSPGPGDGYRHMRQCYMDRDTVGSRRKVLARQYAGRQTAPVATD